MDRSSSTSPMRRKESATTTRVDHDLLHDCRVLVLAMNTTWRGDTDDQLPNGYHLAMEWLSQIRAALDQQH